MIQMTERLMGTLPLARLRHAILRLSLKRQLSQNPEPMSAQPAPISLPTDLVQDFDAVIDHVSSGKPLDPAVAVRVRERAARITAEILRMHGVLDVAVPAIRGLRDS
jgi:hypothetical protein